MTDPSNSSQPVHLNITVRGKVQGVWFRKSTQQKANELGVLGWVSNQTDGSVYIEVEGPVEKVEALLLWCHKGSPISWVDTVEHENAGMKGFSNFEIRY